MPIRKKYIISIDQSTSASKIILFNKLAELVHRVSIPQRQIYPQPDFVEHDATEIFIYVLSGLNRLFSETKILESEIAVLVITNQREISLIWDRISGLPFANAAVWQWPKDK
jgi:glycerol kinase